MAQSIQVPVTQTGLEASIEAAAKKAGRNLQINLGTNAKSISSLSQPLGKITGQANEFTKSMEAANARVFAFGASVGVINAVSKAFSLLVKSTIEVEKSLTEINIVLNQNSKDLDKFGNQLFDVAKKTGQSFEVAAAGALELSRQGLEAADVVKRLNDALVLSRLSGLDATQSVEGLTAAINSFKEAGISSEQIINKLVNVSQKYAVSERDLIEGIKRSASVAEQAGVSFDELVGIITTVQERTARGGAVIGNAFKTIFSKIQDKGALQDLQDLGIKVTDLQGRILPATDILKNLAVEFEGLSQIQQTDIAKKLGGVYQLSNLLAALKDLGSENSKYTKIVELSSKSTNEAYQKNAALNETLAALINKVTVSAEQLGATLGKIGITDSAKTLLNFFNGILEGIQKILGEESAMGDFVRGIVKGIGALVTGPGLALFGAIIAKLSKDLVAFGFSSLKSFLGIGNAAQEIANVQKTISNSLLTNKGIQEQILQIEGMALSVEEKRALQTKFFTDALNTQLAAMKQMQAISTAIAPGVRASTGSGKRAANGYIPQEAADIRKGVGGARAGDRPVEIPNFAFGGGKRGTMVAHTGEYIVPNYAGGGSAIFNRDMVASMGLPSGAKKIGAAGGFIPNFAPSYTPEQIAAAKEFSLLGARGQIDPSKLKIAARGQSAKSEFARKLLGQSASSASIYNAENSPASVMLLPQVVAGHGISHTFKDPYLSRLTGKGYDAFVGRAYGINPSLKGSNSKLASLTGLEGAMDGALATAANSVLGQVAPLNTNPKKVDANNIESLINAAGGAGAVGSIKGALFEAVVNAIVSGITQEAVASEKNNTLDVVFGGKNREKFEEIFGLEKGKYSYGDYKNSELQKDKYVRQVIDNVPRKASRGFIPNFANPLAAAIERERAAGVPDSQIYIDKNESLKSASNPMGWMVANRRDEPAGGTQGINRARREGRNPQTYGAASGFVPNFADLTMGDLGTKSSHIAASLDDLNRKIKDLNTSIAKNKITYDEAQKELSDFTHGISGAKAATKDKVLGVASARLEQPREKTQRDMLGTIFALQAGLSLLTGATADAESQIGKYTNIIAKGASTFTTVAFAIQGLSSGSGKLGTLFSKLGPYGLAIGAAFSAVQAGAGIFNEYIGITKIAKEVVSEMAEAAKSAAISLDELSEKQKSNVIESTDALFRRLTNDSGGVKDSDVPDLLDKIFPDNIEGFGSEGPNAIKEIFKVGIAAGIDESKIGDLYDILKTNDERGPLLKEEITKNEISKFKDQIADLVRATGPAKQALLDFDISKNPEVKQALLSSDEEFRDILKIPNRNRLDGAGLEDPLQPLRSVLGKFGVENIDSQNRLIEISKRLAEQEKEKQKSKQDQISIDQINLELAKKQLDYSLEISKLNSDRMTGLDKIIASAEILGGVSEKELRFLKERKEVEEAGVTLADERRKILSDQISKLNSLGADKFKTLSVSDDLLKLTNEDLANLEKVQEVITKIRSIPTEAGVTGPAELELLNEELAQTQERYDQLIAKIEEAFDYGEAIRGLKNFNSGLAEGFNKLKNQGVTFSYDLGTKIPEMFSDGMASAMMELIESGKSFGEIMQDAAYNFVKEINTNLFKNTANELTGLLAGKEGSGGVVGAGISAFSGLFRASGGAITGGSGHKDDVPAMLMGGEYVINKRAVSKYGRGFLEALNNGSLQGYAKGGSVQGGKDGYFIPGTRGRGAIEGRNNLLNFATQSFTSGASDRIRNRGNYASINLESESTRLTHFGRTNSPQAEAVRSAKQQAFDLYLQDLSAEKAREKEQEAKDKAFRNQLIMLGISSVAGPALKAGAAGFSNAYGTSGGSVAAGLKGIYSGADISGNGTNVAGGLKNLFTGGNAYETIPTARIVKEFEVAMGDLSAVGADSVTSTAASTGASAVASGTGSGFRATAYGLASIDPTTALDQKYADQGRAGYEGFSQTEGASGRTLVEGYSVASNKFPLGSILIINGREFRVDDRGSMSAMGYNTIDFFSGGNKALYNQFAGWGNNLDVQLKRATGGSIPNAGGVDTVPAMLSGGEFVMNRAAAQNIGAGNLQALNSGATSLPSQEQSKELNEKVLAKLDELIEATGNGGSITINVDGATGKSSQTNDNKSADSKQQLARQIRDAVIKVINDEKRLGGQLRRSM